MSKSPSLARIIATILASVGGLTACGAGVSPTGDGGDTGVDARGADGTGGDASDVATDSLPDRFCGMCGCDFTGRAETNIPMQLEYCAGASGARPIPPPEDSGAGFVPPPFDSGVDSGSGIGIADVQIPRPDAPSPADAMQSDTGIADVTRPDSSPNDPATCELDCQRACGSVFIPGAPPPPAGLRTCERVDAMTVKCIAMFPCGRAPDGLDVRRASSADPMDPIAVYLAECATIEAASVDAFERLARELRAFGAPEHLARAAVRSAMDERKHASMMASLAASHGTSAHEFNILDDRTRTLEDLAHENAVEGCVRETWGALLAAYQREHAEDAAVREAMAVISVDEQKHASLAWRVAHWAEPKLSDASRERIQRDRDAAFDQLLAELAREPEERFTRAMGLPSARVALAMAEALRAQLS
ncbi:MAG: hypothetical protein JNK05_08145 [Myxococcales bacterium]|nr:hypothetical protein [Myxococcales bacterium]